MEQLSKPVSYSEQRDNILARLRRIEGQVRGLQRMIENDRYCLDIVTQIVAVQSALNQVGINLLESHAKKCVAEALQHGDEHQVDELIAVIRRFIK